MPDAGGGRPRAGARFEGLLLGSNVAGSTCWATSATVAQSAIR